MRAIYESLTFSISVGLLSSVYRFAVCLSLPRNLVTKRFVNQFGSSVGCVQICVCLYLFSDLD